MTDKRWPPPTIADIDAWHTLAPLQGPYLPWSAGALRPAGLVTVLNEIAARGLQHVLECGAGVSSVFIARLLAQRNGKLVTLEDDRAWAAWLRSQLHLEDLNSHAEVIDAPLEPCTKAAEGLGWYAEEATDRALRGLPAIQLLLVDGPQAYQAGKGLARLPALPMFRHALADDATVVLDDIGRPGEREVLNIWEREFDLTFELRPGARVAIGRLGNASPFPRI